MMNETKLTVILGKLSKDEFREFGKFVRSPYFNERLRLIKLYDALKSYHPGFDQRDFNRDVIFKKLYPSEKYNDMKLRSAFTALFKLAEEFLSYSEYKNDRFLFETNLLKALHKKGADKFFLKHMESSEKNIGENRTSFIDEFYRRRELKDIKIDFNLKRDKQILVGEEVIRREEYGAFHLALQIMDGYSDMIANQYSFKTQFRGSAADEFFKCVDIERFTGFLKKSSNPNYPAIAMNYYILKAMVEYEQSSHIANFMKLYNEFIDSFTRSEQLHFYRRYENYLIISHHMRSNNENERLSFGMYKAMIDKDLYSTEEGGYISYSFFSNIFFVALALKEFKWLEKFVAVYVHKLRPEIRDEMFNVCAAYIEFRKGNFETALEYINKVSYELYQLKLTVKYLMLQIYYELGWLEPLYSLIDTSKHFLAKNKVMSEAPIERYICFIKFLSSLAKLKSGADNLKVDELKAEITQTKNVSGKEWLLEKADELSKI